jgi:hypothetical protein
MSSRCGGRSEGFLNTSRMSMCPVCNSTQQRHACAARQAGVCCCWCGACAAAHLERPAPCDTQAGPGFLSLADRTQAPAPPPRLLTANTAARYRLAGLPAWQAQHRVKAAACSGWQTSQAAAASTAWHHSTLPHLSASLPCRLS